MPIAELQLQLLVGMLATLADHWCQAPHGAQVCRSAAAPLGPGGGRDRL